MPQSLSTNKLTLLLTLGIIVMGSNSLLLSPILRDVAGDLRTSPVVVAWVISAFGAATAVSSFFFGGVIDKLGYRRVLLGGATIMALSLIGCSVSTAWYWLALCQAVIGLCVGVMLPAVYAAATSNAPLGEGARVLGRVISGWGIALVLGVPSSAFLSDLFGWRATFAILAALTALSLVGFFQLPRQSAVRSQTAPVSPFRALKIPGVLPLLVICLSYMTAFYGLYAFLGDHLRSVLDLTAGQAGIVVLGYGAGFVLASFADAAIDRIGTRKTFPTTLALLAGVYLLLVPATQNYLSAILIAAVWGFVNHIAINLIVLLLSQRDKTARGALMGLQTAATYTSVFLGPLLMGAFYPLGFHLVAGAAAVLLAFSAIVAWKFCAAVDGVR
ncbi:MFS transporter [Roseibium algae]|uniref:MFS transporter n=1 Tax=Roseibium algae TaxID=3123038 RepID=A0ABU8TPE0_9HYPH